MNATVRGGFGVHARGAAVRVHVDDAAVVIDVIRPWRLAHAAGLGGVRGLRALAAMARALRGASRTIRIRTGAGTVLTTGRGVRRFSPLGLALAALVVLSTPGRPARPHEAAR